MTAWPTATDLVTYVQTLVADDAKNGHAEVDLDDLLDMADQLFPEIPEDDAQRDAFHRRAESIMKDAQAQLETWLTGRATVDLTEWVPALAQEIHGKKWSPNLDTVTHLEAQQRAKVLGIQWGKSMPATDVEKLKTAMRDMYVARNARSTKRK